MARDTTWENLLPCPWIYKPVYITHRQGLILKER